MNLSERDLKVIWHPFTPQKNMLPPIGIVKGKDTLLYDEQGTAYIDAISSWWVTLHGHGNAYIAEKLYQQALQIEQVIFAGFTHEPAVALAEKLLPLLPGKMARIFYSDNGSTSTEVAIKMAIQYWWNKQDSATTNPPKKVKILAFNDAYHGDTFGAMSVSDRSVFTKAFESLLFEVVFIDTPTTDNIPHLLETVATHKDSLAAFIYEPLLQGAGGMKMYSAEAMNTLLAFVQSHNIICIADEVMTGFGRTGQLFASNYLKYPPHIICLSKGLTGGTMALGVTACVEAIYQAFVSDNKLHTFFHGHSFTANPLACTAALASLELIERNKVMEKVNWIAEQHREYIKRFSKVVAEFPVINIRQLGTILAFDIDQGQAGYLNDISVRFTELALKLKIYIRPLGNTVYIMPPYCITDRELYMIYYTIVDVLAKIFITPYK